jgi:hypothetical protein
MSGLVGDAGLTGFGGTGDSGARGNGGVRSGRGVSRSGRGAVRRNVTAPDMRRPSLLWLPTLVLLGGCGDRADQEDSKESS